MKLNWSNKLFFYTSRLKRKNKKIGHEVLINSRSQGKFAILSGMCVNLKNKRGSSLKSSLTLKRDNSDVKYNIIIPIYLTGAIKFNVIGSKYGYNVNSSKLLNYRLKKT